MGGASVHEVAQVVAAGFARGDVSGELATVSKLARVLLLAPVVIGLGWSLRGRALAADTDGASAKPSIPIPWFVFGFLAWSFSRARAGLDPAWRSQSALIAQLLLAFALSAVGSRPISVDSSLRAGNRSRSAPLPPFSLAEVPSSLSKCCRTSDGFPKNDLDDSPPSRVVNASLSTLLPRCSSNSDAISARATAQHHPPKKTRQAQ